MYARLFALIFALGVLLFPELVKAQPDTSVRVVRGTVVDAVSLAPIIGVTVTLTRGDATIKGAITTSSGAFTLKGIPLGRYTLRVKSIAHEPYSQENVLVTAGKDVILSIALEERLRATDAIVVSVDRSTDATLTNSDMAIVSARAFNVDDTKRYAGSLGDPSRMAQNFAGVVGANDARNDIVVRGNSPAGMVWQMEGMNIPNPNHFGAFGTQGGPVSILNNNVLAKSDFFTSAFPASYGNGIAGVFDLRTRNGNDEKFEYVAQVGFNGAELGVEGPLWQGASLLVNYRYSTLALFDQIGLSAGTGGAVPNYQDINLRFNTSVGDQGTLTVFAAGGTSDISFFGADIDTAEANFYGDENRNILVDYRTGWAGVRYDHRLDENTLASLTIGASALDNNFGGDSLDWQTKSPYRDQEASFTTTTLSAVGSLRHKLSAATTLVGGFLIDRRSADLLDRTDIGLSTERDNVRVAESDVLTQFYVTARHRLSQELSATVGIHTQQSTLGDDFAVEPRLGLAWYVGNGVSIHGGYGLHSQTQPLYTYYVQTPTQQGPQRTNSSLGFTRAHHAVIGTDWFVEETWRFKLEAYYQSLFDVPVTIRSSSYAAINSGTDFAPDTQDSLINNGTGRNIGLELTAEHSFRDGFFALATVSVFDSKYKGSDGIERNTAYNMNYAANLLVGKEFNLTDRSVFTVSIRLAATGGRLLTPLDVNASKRQTEAVFDESRAFSERQPAYFRADVKLGYRVDFGAATMEFSVDLQNVSNAENVFLQRYNPRTNTIATEFQQGFLPVPTFRLTF